MPFLGVVPKLVFVFILEPKDETCAFLPNGLSVALVGAAVMNPLGFVAKDAKPPEVGAAAVAAVLDPNALPEEGVPNGDLLAPLKPDCPKTLPEVAAVPEDGVPHTEPRFPKPPAVPKAAPPVDAVPRPMPPIMLPIGVEDPKEGCPKVEPPFWEVAEMLVGAPDGDSDLLIAPKLANEEPVEANVEAAGLLKALLKLLWPKGGAAWVPALVNGETCLSGCGPWCV